MHSEILFLPVLRSRSRPFLLESEPDPKFNQPELGVKAAEVLYDCRAEAGAAKTLEEPESPNFDCRTRVGTVPPENQNF